jgi:hypothetical protein
MTRCPSDSYIESQGERGKLEDQGEGGSTKSTVMGIRRWWTRDLDKGEWRRLLKEAKTLREL